MPEIVERETYDELLDGEDYGDSVGEVLSEEPPEPVPSDPAPAPVDEAEPAAEPAVETPEAKPDTELGGDEAEPEAVKPDVDTVDTKGEGEADGDGVFDPRSFAESYGLNDPELFKNCKDEQEALRIVANTHKTFRQIYGRHTQEVGEARRRIAELEAELQGRPAPPPVPGTTTTSDGTPSGSAGTPIAEMTPEEREQFLYELETTPEKVLARIKAEAEQSAFDRLQEENERRQSELESQKKAEELDREFEDFTKAVPNWTERRDVMKQVCHDLGREPSYMEMWNLAGLRLQHPAEYGNVASKMQRGYEFEDAVRLTFSNPDSILGNGHKAGGASVAQPKSRTTRMLHGPTGPARVATASALPVGVTDLSDDDAAGAPY